MNSPEPNEKLIRMLLARLERVSVDSYWAHRASGVRGELLRILEQMETGEAINSQMVKRSFKAGFEILFEAAKEKYR